MAESTYLRVQEQTILVRFADLLIPGGAGMPKASESDLTSGFDRIFKIRPDLIDAARALIADLGSTDERILPDIRARHPERFLDVAELIAGSYFLDKSVTGILDYLDKETIPLDDEEARLAALAELTAPVVRRGNTFRLTGS
ncbi:hypothetical protein ATK23_0100 [Glutamicibacter mysorens]|uniref:Uncharacterized protein n=1 Tax=Glutamicibacter mysorens TaxID=257984 RepID=A0ABX4MZ66_9MICC|nr:hypothetical protein [Glutamicibacter mysorens]PJJ42942.1 hypothetical protein ATK23_0100 [Glutamicibacter mysorens]